MVFNLWQWLEADAPRWARKLLMYCRRKPSECIWCITTSSSNFSLSICTSTLTQREKCRAGATSKIKTRP